MSRLRVPIRDDDHVTGPRDAPIALVEYGDFECPYCGQAYPEVKRVLQALGDRVCFAFRNFPLTRSHPHAEQAAEAAEAAGAQGEFWEMHDVLYENQGSLGQADLVAYARSLRLDLRRFGEDLDTQRFHARVRRDFLSGVRSGVNGTPTFFINGSRHDGASTAEALLEAIESGPPVYLL